MYDEVNTVLLVVLVLSVVKLLVERVKSLRRIKLWDYFVQNSLKIQCVCNSN